MRTTPNPEDVGPYYAWGEIGRMMRRYRKQVNSFVLNTTLRAEIRAPFCPLLSMFHLKEVIDGNFLSQRATSLKETYLSTLKRI